MTDYDDDIIDALHRAGTNGPPMNDVTVAALDGGRAALRRRRLVSASAAGVGAVTLAVAATLTVQAIPDLGPAPVADDDSATPTCPAPVEPEVPASAPPAPAPPDATFEEVYPPGLEEAMTESHRLNGPLREKTPSFVAELGPDWYDVYADDPALGPNLRVDPPSASTDGLPAGWRGAGSPPLVFVDQEGADDASTGCVLGPDGGTIVLDTDEVTTADGDVIVIEYLHQAHPAPEIPEGFQSPKMFGDNGIRQIEVKVTRMLDDRPGILPLAVSASVSAANSLTGRFDQDAVEVGDGDVDTVRAWLESYVDVLIEAVDDAPVD